MYVCVCVLRHYSQELLELLLNIDKLLATDEHFLLGVWLESAKNMSTGDQERRLYEYNARNQITLWGPDGNVCSWHLLFILLHELLLSDILFFLFHCLIVGFFRLFLYLTYLL